MPENPERILFVTGRLAEPALRQTLETIRSSRSIDAEVVVLGINVAALMHVGWVARKLEVPAGITRVILPGWCQGELAILAEKYGVPFERGPKDLRELPRYLSGQEKPRPDLSRYDIEIIAEINHAPVLEPTELLRLAQEYRAAGADRIDYGCIPGERFAQTPEHIRLLIDEGFQVSIDSFDQQEVEQAVKAGASLVLSCNSTNVDWASQLDAELVVIPDDFNQLQTMSPIIEQLTSAGKSFRLDPILEPIGFGFFRSVQRYAETRRLWPDLPIMMGVGNVTELSEVDSAGINFLLAAICQELRIESVLTTQVINWARSSVRELDIARRLMKFALEQKQIPKHLDPRLVRLRDPYLYSRSPTELAALAAQLKDPNFRIFAEPDGLHLMNRAGHWQGNDPFELMHEALQVCPVDASHAFYLGYELAQAETARLLGKQYVQDEPLQWGDLTAPKITQADRHALRQQKHSELPPESPQPTSDSR